MTRIVADSARRIAFVFVSGFDMSGRTIEDGMRLTERVPYRVQMREGLGSLGSIWTGWVAARCSRCRSGCRCWRSAG